MLWCKVEGLKVDYSPVSTHPEVYYSSYTTNNYLSIKEHSQTF